MTRSPDRAICADIGSTFTKVAVVDLRDGQLLATAGHPTTADSDVLHGLDAAVAATGVAARAGTRWYVCSSAGGGLRLAVVGHEELVTAQAGRQVALSAGARVVHVHAGRLDAERLAELRGADPDVVLLVGGTDDGDAQTILHNASQLARARLRLPVVLAGNAAVREQALQALTRRGVPTRAVENVLPRIGVLQPAPARSAIREVFLRHVIGGKGISRGPRLGRMLRAATPDAVLSAVELLADHGRGDLLVVDVGGATTDVYSTLTPDALEQTGPDAEVAGTLWRARTVEGDLGMRWGAPGVVDAAVGERLLDADGIGPLRRAAAGRAADPGVLPDSAPEQAHDQLLAQLAATVALRRHARGGRIRRDLRDVRLVVGSGGVLRHLPATAARSVLRNATSDHAGGWPVPRQPRLVVDTDYVLAAAGLLAGEHPHAALALLSEHTAGG